jgi:hypothetical protein
MNIDTRARPTLVAVGDKWLVMDPGTGLYAESHERGKPAAFSTASAADAFLNTLQYPPSVGWVELER